MTNETDDKPVLLLVDDDEVYCEVLGDALRKRGYEVSIAHDLANAVQLAQQTEPEYAVVDLRIGTESGLELVKQLAVLDENTRIIMLTGYPTIDSAVECTKLGAFKYLEKPYDFEKLVEVIKEAYEARLKKKVANNKKRMEEIQSLSLRETPLGLLRALARLDNEEK